MRHSNKSQYTEINERVIYVLRSPLTKEFFIGHCRKDLLKSIFQHHYYGERYQTKEFCEILKKQGLHPCLFILEEVTCTKVEAFNYVIVWTKIFIEKGYESLNKGNVISYTDDLLKDNQTLYNERISQNIDQLTRCAKCVVATYNRKECVLFNDTHNEAAYIPEDKSNEIKVYLSDSELKQIKRNAKACDKTVSAYIREVGLNMQPILLDHTIVTQHTNEISAYRNAINLLIYTIKKTGNYTPADLEYILEKTKEVLKSEKTFLQNYNSFIEKIKKDVAKKVKTIVESHLSPKTKSSSTK